MIDAAHQKFAALIAEVETLEESVADLQTRAEKNPADQTLRPQLLEAQRQLGEKRTELSRVSNGCGKPRA